MLLFHSPHVAFATRLRWKAKPQHVNSTVSPCRPYHGPSGLQEVFPSRKEVVLLWGHWEMNILNKQMCFIFSLSVPNAHIPKYLHSICMSVLLLSTPYTSSSTPQISIGKRTCLKDITDFLSCHILLFSISKRKLLWWYITSSHFRFLPLMSLITVQKISLIRKLI